MSVELQYPWLLGAALLILIALAVPKKRKQQIPAIFWPGALASELSSLQQSNLSDRISRWLLTISAIALVIAASNPLIMGDQANEELDARDLMLAVDISQSMERADLQLNGRPAQRIDVVKAVVSDFAERRTGDRLGLILFGSQAYLQAPLTFDRKALNQLLIEAQLGFAGPKTAIGDAIGMAIKRLQERPSDKRTLILLTDGANTDGTLSPVKGAQLAAAAGIKIYTIGVGANQMQSSGLFGTSIGSRTINPSAELDEETLQQISDLTGGQYFRAYSTQDLVEVYETLDQLEPMSQPKPGLRPFKSIAYWFALAALIFFVAGWLLRRRLA